MAAEWGSSGFGRGRGRRWCVGAVALVAVSKRKGFPEFACSMVRRSGDEEEGLRLITVG
jgi:hypothetical protein